MFLWLPSDAHAAGPRAHLELRGLTRVVLSVLPGRPAAAASVGTC